MDVTHIIIFLVFLLQVELVSSSGTISLRLITYANRQGEGNNGQCCDGRSIFCPSGGGCDHYFIVCMDTINSGNSMPTSCPYGKHTTGATDNQRSITFGSTIGGTPNPINFRFRQWPNGMKIKVDVYDKDGNADDFVDFVSVSFVSEPSFGAATPSSRRLVLQARTSLIVDVRVFCSPNFYGSHCTRFCSPADNNRVGHYTCSSTGFKICLSGWTGGNCTVDVNECASDPCLYGGRCVDQLSSYTCQCPHHFTGARCEDYVSPCGSAPCLNNATCLADFGDAHPTCDCSEHYRGPVCDEPVPCASQPCLNNGICEEINSSTIICHCSSLWTGDLCEERVDPCADHSCENNATCVGLIEPTQSCLNATSCTELIHLDFNCTCVDGFTGRHCEDDVNECLSTPCHHNQQCIDLIGSFVCNCSVGLSGERCQVDIDECVSDPCMNGGSCIDQRGGHQCRCIAGWTGDYCETGIVSPCVYPVSCMNGGNCSMYQGEQQCSCIEGYTGKFCEVSLVEDMTSSPAVGHYTSDKDLAKDLTTAASSTVRSTLVVRGTLTDKDLVPLIALLKKRAGEYLGVSSTEVSIDAPIRSCTIVSSLIISTVTFSLRVNADLISPHVIGEILLSLPGSDLVRVLPLPLVVVDRADVEACVHQAVPALTSMSMSPQKSLTARHWPVILGGTVSALVIMLVIVSLIYTRRNRRQYPVSEPQCVPSLTNMARSSSIAPKAAHSFDNRVYQGLTAVTEPETRDKPACGAVGNPYQDVVFRGRPENNQNATENCCGDTAKYDYIHNDWAENPYEMPEDSCDRGASAGP